ncbi:hypothetical protein LOTGIDRAFT_127041 [Lottia gigantea]|uniref:G-protein coupled receptors family 1 profile domain-containing protein n=1 Tax=Lottia gigantea TaxID=225164 RepID=V3ZA82_LOTGI|nr:hypothetical protein LOTGIDRAFT_127041 [Lottia gigantea]ESO87858.1 hypothetical protein LOTGIDRAFT_127041 [Lottia gigantea]
MGFSYESDVRLNNSYFIVKDGLENRSYFTYYSEFNRKYGFTPYVEATVLILISIFSTMANLTIFFLLTCNKSLRTVTNVFIGSLAMSDLLFTLSGPVIAACRITESWTFGHFACDFIVYMQFVCGSVSIWTMTMISVERYFCIVRGSNSTITPRVAVIAVVVMWIVALISYSSVIASFTVLSLPFGNTTVTICTLMWPWNSVQMSRIFTIFVFIFTFLVPLIVLTHNYATIFLKFRKVRMIVNQSRIQNSNLSEASENIQRTRNARDMKVVKTVFSLVIIFAVMWFPICGCFVYILVDNATGSMELGSYVFIIALMCAMGNGCVNPILYGVMNERLKLILLSCCLSKCDSEDNSNRIQSIAIKHIPNAPHRIQTIQEDSEGPTDTH